MSINKVFQREYGMVALNAAIKFNSVANIVLNSDRTNQYRFDFRANWKVFFFLLMTLLGKVLPLHDKCDDWILTRQSGLLRWLITSSAPQELNVLCVSCQRSSHNIWCFSNQTFHLWPWLLDVNNMHCVVARWAFLCSSTIEMQLQLFNPTPPPHPLLFIAQFRGKATDFAQRWLCNRCVSVLIKDYSAIRKIVFLALLKHKVEAVTYGWRRGWWICIYSEKITSPDIRRTDLQNIGDLYMRFLFSCAEIFSS